MFILDGKKKTPLFFIHFLVGLILWKFPFISTYISWIIILIGSYVILKKPDPKGHFPLIFSAYIVGFEVLLRMTNARVFWEFGKYSVILFLILGFIRNKREKNIHFLILIYFILLLPSIFLLPLESFNQWRQSITFNLSGPACLLISTQYLFNTKLTVDDIKNILLYSLLPIFSTAIFVILRMPDIDTYIFVPYSNKTTSGGYGPNQVSTIFGFGIVALVYLQVMKEKSNYNQYMERYIDWILLILFMGLGLLTFSRGGIFAAVISSSIAVSFYFFFNQRKIQFLFKSTILLFITIITWINIENITNGVISERYGFSSLEYENKVLMDLTGRAEIYFIDMEIFFDNIFTGVGPGQANHLRKYYGYSKNVAAHIEYSRMLSEHGLLGLISLFILFGVIFHHFLIFSPRHTKFLKILFGLLSLITMSHSAMRLAMPCFILGFIFPKYEE